jgi:hypothetical protein
VDLHSSLPRPGVEEPPNESQRLKDLERAGMHHRRAVPMERPGSGINQMAGHTTPLKLRSEEQPRRTRTDHEHGRTVACVGTFTLLGRLF